MLSYVELSRAAALLERELRDARLQAAAQPEQRAALGLTFYGRGEGDADARRIHVLLSGDPESARVSLLAHALHGAPSPPAFVQFVRAHCVGARVAAVRMAEGERELAIALHGADGDFELLLAIFGRRSNLYVLDAERRIRAALRPLAETRSELALGEPWRSPQAAAPRRGEDRFADVADDDLLAAIETTYAERESEGLRGALARRIGQALRKEAKTLDRKLEHLDAELAGAEADTALERQGELLKTALSGLKRGAREARVRDPANDEEVVIALDPTLSPSENLERLFKRYRKAVRALAKGGAQREAVREARAAIATLERELESAGDDVAALEALAARDELAPLLTRHAPEPAVARVRESKERTIAGRVLPLRLVPRRYRTESGLEIWVGRSDEANDLLSTRLARGNDLFFHLDGAPGSHVILRTEGRTDPPSEAVLDACELAVHFSKQKNATRADVHVVPAKNVRKPKGAKPGLVMVHGGRSVHLRREPKRLERILAAKIED
jgi:predicted ribosome quality control (RQC) complex YloA/Tae2 family protein